MARFHTYIFLGGLIPSLAAHTTMEVVERRSIGLEYAETLHRWRENFLAREPQVRALGFDETFVRMWDFYLAYSEAGFARDRPRLNTSRGPAPVGCPRTVNADRRAPRGRR